MIRPVTSADRAVLRGMLAEFYDTDAVLHPLPASYHDAALDELFRITHETEHAVIRLRFIRTVLPEGEAVTPLEGQSFGWFDLKEPMPPDLLAPDRPVWEFLAE